MAVFMAGSMAQMHRVTMEKMDRYSRETVTQGTRDLHMQFKQPE